MTAETTTGTTPAGATALGTIHQLDPCTVLVTGQPLDLDRQQPDVANSVLHRTGATLVMIDTGATPTFRTALLDAVDRVGPWDRLLVLTSHGHLDHVGNNDLADELADTRGVQAQHYYPVADTAQMTDPATYWRDALAAIAGVVDLPASPAATAAELASWFRPLHPITAASRAYETLPLRPLSIGFHHTIGWTLADGAVQILPSQGHCAGHVIIHLPRAGLLHVGDELNGPTACLPDADQLKLTTARQAITTMLEDSRITTVTDGHRPGPLTADDANHLLGTERDRGLDLLNWTTRTVADRPDLQLTDLLPRFMAQAVRRGLTGPNPSPVFTAMTAVNALRGLGYHPVPGSITYRRPAVGGSDRGRDRT